MTHALVTGASSGIGRELARGLARAGAEVTCVARRAPLLDELVGEIVAAGGRARALVLDVTDTETLVAALRALDEATPVDLVIANAGAGAAPGQPPTSWEAIAAACRTSFLGAAATVTALLPRMVARRGGHIVGLSSLSAVATALPEAAAYAAPKAGLSALLACLRVDVAPAGVAVTTVHAGFVDTAMTRGADHPLPMLWSAERAARHILARLPRRPARIDFPWALALAARASRLLPRALAGRFARRYRHSSP